ncbi:NADPH--cytochrome P450 reductase-like [Penaeus monodon]|uniref:NADPH--cytochrome P450 reductase-like n=1 Tax=Penaeus monodon TaxID=6687 RepID=UPI0018A6F2E9|nr:NADPH--cytochrome P450 reductase-like [Penaeus monodon]
MEESTERLVDAASAAAEEMAEEPLVGMLDLVLLSLLAGVSVYYFFLRDTNKKDEVPALKSFTISPTSLPMRTNDSNFVGKMKSSGRNVIVFYGSQTGTAEEFAGRLAKEATRWGMKGMVADPEECDMSELAQLTEIENHLAVFCVATYGEGDPTDNAQEFYEFLQNGDDQLDGLQYTVFGLGNKTYEHYNAMGKYVDKRLEELGATRVFELGMGDDDANMEDDFITWKDAMWPKVCKSFGFEAQAQDINMRQYKLKIHKDYEPTQLYTGELARLNSLKIGSQKPPFDSKNPFMAEIVVNRELFNGGERNCMHIELDVEGSRIRYVVYLYIAYMAAVSLKDNKVSEETKLNHESCIQNSSMKFFASFQKGANKVLYRFRDAKKMARDVHTVIIQICQTEGGMTPGEAELYVKKMINQKRYSSDVWS